MQFKLADSHLCSLRLLCVYEALAHRDMIMCILSSRRSVYNYPVHTSVLDRYGTGTVPLHLSISVNASLILYRSVPIRDPVFCRAPSGTNCSGTDWSAQFLMWTGGMVPFRNRYGRMWVRTNPNCIGTVCTDTVPLQMWTG